MSSKNGSTSTNAGLWALVLGLLANWLCPQTGHAVALAVKETIDLRGNHLTTDSFDSGDPTYSDNSYYPAGDFSKIKDHGDVWAGWALTNSLNAGGADIMGSLKTGAGMQPAWFGPESSVGDKNWVANGNVGIQPGHASNDFNTVFGGVAVPPTSWLPALPTYQTINGTNYTYTFFNSGNYFINNLSGSIYVGTNANIKLRLAGSVRLSDQGAIRISPQNATLRMFMDGPSCSFSNTACIDNQSGHADRCCLFGTPNCTNINLAGNKAFCGIVYAPQADFTLNGGSSNPWDFIGCCITKSLTLYSDVNFHGDENWERVGTLPPWITAQPQSQTVPIGSCPELKVGAQWASNYTGQGGANFQWRFNGTDIPGATNASLTLTNITASQAGTYSVLVKNELGSLSSSNALLSVYHPAAALLGSPQGLGGNRLQFSISIQPGFRYAVEASTNLMNWVSVATNTGSCLFEDSEASQFPRRYYRSVYLP